MNIITKISIVIILLIVGNVKAQIPAGELQKASKNFISKTSVFKKQTVSNDILNLRVANKTVAYCVNLIPEGYIIFTASKKLSPVFSFSEKGKFNIEESKKQPVFQDLLKHLSKVEEIIDNNKSKYQKLISKNQKEWENLISQKKSPKEDYQYGVYLTDIWGGVNCWDNEGNMVYPTNYFTPNHYSAGCVAISAAQILHYYEWPVYGTGYHTDNDNSGSSQGSYSVSFGTTKYDWANMLDDYQGEYSTDDEQRAVGRLMYHAAVAVDMDFENSGSTSNVIDVPNALQTYFRMTGHYQTISWSEFGTRLRQNLENGMPVQFGVKSDGGDEHACVCDGYRYNEGETKYYHMNMGWWNWYGGNAWYNIFGDFNAVGYTSITGGVFDIVPKPVMNTVVRTSDYHQFIVNWKVSKKLQWESFDLEQSYNNGTWTTVATGITDTLYNQTVTADGNYKYRVRAKINGSYISDSYSNVGVVQVGEITCLDLDGDDSFFINDSYNKLDLSNEWTYEAWVKTEMYNSGDWSVIMDRRSVISLYLIDDADADFAVKFAIRDASDNITSSIQSDNSSVNLELGKWFHVAVSRDGTTTRFFINGELIGQSTDADYILTSSTNALNVGARYWGSYSRYFTGQIDEIKVSDKAQYTQEFCPDRFDLLQNDNNTILLLNLQYGTGTALFDASRNFSSVSLRSSPYTASWYSEAVPIINTQPRNETACSGSVNFNLDADYADNYQWQINSGTGFVNLTNDANISGATTNSLTIADVSTFTDNNYIRCILSNTPVSKTCSETIDMNIYTNCTVWNGTSWSNGLPDATKSAIIDANYIADNFITTDNLTINEGDTLFINENYTLDVKGDFLNKGVLALKSDNANQIPGTFIHTGDVINYGNMISEIKYDADYNYLITSPVNTSNLISEVFTNNPNLYENSGTVDTWTLFEGNSIQKQTPYLYSSIDNDKAVFVGDFNTGTLKTKFRKLGGDDFAFAINPYPSVIDWNATSGWINDNIKTNLYTFDATNNGNSGNFSVWDGTVGIHAGNGYIKPGEAFFVNMSDYRSSIQTSNDVQISTADMTTVPDTPQNLIRFQFENEDATIYDEGIVYFSDSENKPIKPMPLKDDIHYTFFPSSGKKYAIQRLHNPGMDTLISVGFKTSQGGQITFRVTDFTIDANTPVQLKDLLTGEYTMLENGSTYTFTAGTSEPDNRFKLYFGSYVVDVNNVKNEVIKTWSDGKTIFIQNYKNQNFNYEVYNVLGELLTKGVSNSDFTNIKNLNTGINILKIYQGNSTQTNKFIITNN